MKSNYFKISAVASSLLIAMSAQAAIPEGASFKGYAVAGAGFSNSDILNTAAYDWANNGFNIFRLDGTHYDHSGGRLGNEANWLEMYMGYGFAETNGMTWGFKANVVSDGATLDLDEIYTQATGVFKSNPDATIWVGKRYYGRVSTNINDTLPLQNDGYGFGIETVDIGFADLELSVTRNLYDGSSNDDQNAVLGDLTAFQSAIKGIHITDGAALDLFANYGAHIGPNSKSDVTKENTDSAYQLATQLRLGDWNNWNNIFLRYSNNASHSITATYLIMPEHQIGGFWEGVYNVTDNYRIHYVWSHETSMFDDEARFRTGARGYNYGDVDKKHWNALVLRNSYTWNERFTTELETGYESAKFKTIDGGSQTNDGYKVTLSQNIHINSGFWDRPVIRFFVTYASQDVAKATTTDWNSCDENWVCDGPSKIGKTNATTVGAQFEAWW
ncbi:carbohydrate porin [Aliagarivorans taiwanensis]|uniref:carbohydrate porin n=1 Tax=Aliagarivorans taiwanensis TaxID=561966 RepID=UPI000426C2DA|nr:carbohydrate porin [Aliagarivorans taiwanensis]